MCREEHILSPKIQNQILSASEDLLLRCANDDKHAFAELYDALSPRVYGIALRVVRDSALAEDIAHDAWMAVWDRAGTFDPSLGSADGWIIAITHRRAVDTVRRIEGTKRRELLDAQRSAPLAVADSEEIASANESRRAVRDCMATISDRQREALSLSYFEGFTQVEIASNLGIETSAVRSRIRKALAGLRRCLGNGRV